MTDLYCKQNAPINQPEVAIHIGVGSLKQSNTGYNKKIIILIQHFLSFLIKPSKFSKNNIRVWAVKEKGKEIKETWPTGRSGKLESAEADIVESFIVKDHTFISILNKLMNRKSSIVWLNDCVGDLGWWENRECQHHAIWVLLSDFWDKKSAHARSRASSQRMAYLESCKGN